MRKSNDFDPLELIPRAYSLSSLTDYTGLRGTGGAEFTKLDVMGAIAAARLGTGDIGPELLQDYAFVRGGIKPIYRDAAIVRIRQEVANRVQAPIFLERCATIAAQSSWGYMIYGYRKDATKKTAKQLCVRDMTYQFHAREAEDFAATALYRAVTRFKGAISKRMVGDTEAALDSETLLRGVDADMEVAA